MIYKRLVFHFLVKKNLDALIERKPYFISTKEINLSENSPSESDTFQYIPSILPLIFWDMFSKTY